MRFHRSLNQAGLSLVELLVVIGIIALLMAIALASMAGGKGAAKSTVGISQMRQLGQAAAIYAEDRGGWPISARFLVDCGAVPKELLDNPNDSTDVGLGNTALLAGYENGGRPNPAPYKNSYGGYLEWEISRIVQSKIEEQPGGWLVDLSSSKRTGFPESLLFSEGSYRRLRYDTSVVVRQHFSIAQDGGTIRLPAMLFLDHAEQTLNEIR